MRKLKEQKETKKRSLMAGRYYRRRKKCEKERCLLLIGPEGFLADVVFAGATGLFPLPSRSERLDFGRLRRGGSEGGRMDLQ